LRPQNRILAQLRGILAKTPRGPEVAAQVKGKAPRQYANWAEIARHAYQRVHIDKVPWRVALSEVDEMFADGDCLPDQKTIRSWWTDLGLDV
jgi:hypothetical protein